MTSQSLHHLRVLVTRPLEQATLFANAIKQHGAEPILFPTVIISPKHNAAAAMQPINHCEIVIFLSANAVKYGAKYFSPAIHTNVLAIGPATTQALLKANIHVADQPKEPFNSEALLVLPLLQSVADKQIGIVTGAEGRDLIIKILRERKAEVIEAIVYERSQPKVDIQHHLSAWQQHGIDVIVVTSRANLANLYNMVGPVDRAWLLSIPLVVISQRLQHFAQELGFTHTLLASNASETAILEVLKAWYAKSF